MDGVESKSVTVAVRLRPSIASRLDAIADGRSKSEVMRDALRLLLATESLAAERGRVLPRHEPPR